MDRDRAKEEILARWEDILRSITSPARDKVNGHTSYICPLCGHGTHGDGLTINPTSRNGYGLKCFSCGFSGDIIDLVGEVDGRKEYPEKLKRAGEYIGIDTDRGLAQNQPKTEQHKDKSIHTSTYTQKHIEPTDYTGFFLQAHSHIAEIDYKPVKALSKAIIDKYNLGYIAEWRHPAVSEKVPTTPRLIIPVNEYCYLARDTRKDIPEAEKNYKKQKVKGADKVDWIYNAKALETATKPVFVVEGEMDALSIIEVGGEAIALGSISNINALVENHLKKHPPAQPLILALDNDTKGQEAQGTLAGKLDELGISYYIGDIYGKEKDASDALVADRKVFADAVAQAESNARQTVEDELEAEREAYLNTSTASHIEEFINGVAESARTPAQPTGFKNLDWTLDGGLYEGLYIIGAITSLGKTTLALQITDQIAQSGKDVLIFSLEMARTELMSKSISRHTYIRVLSTGDTRNAKTNRGITAGARYKTYSPAELDLIDKSVEDYKKYAQHIYIHEGVGDIGVKEIRETVQKHKRITGQTPVILVDYIQLLAPYNDRATDKQNTDKAVLELKRISRDFKTPVIGISSFNRASYNTGAMMEAFKESGAIEYSSDVLIGLQLKGAGVDGFNSLEEKKKDTREIELVVLKNRNGKTGDKIAYNYYPMFNYFEESGSTRVKSERNKF